MQHALLARSPGHDGAASTARPPLVLHGRGLLGARLAFLAFAVLALLLHAASLLRAWRDGDISQFTSGLTVEQLRASLAGTALAPGSYLAIVVGVQLLSNLIYYLAAAFLFWKRSEEAIALLVAAFFISWNASGFPPTLFDELPAAPLRANAQLAVTLVFAVLSLWLFFLFPDGRFVPRWTIAIAAIWAVQNTSDFFVVRSMGGNGPVIDGIEYLVVIGAVIVAQVYRYRRISGPVERQQTKWVLGGLGLFFVTFAIGNVYLAANGLLVDGVPSASGAISWLVISIVNAASNGCVAVALAVAVLRYRLFDIDVIINRALVYGSLTAIVIGVYALIVGYLGTLLRIGTNLPISLLATGVIAILFQPLRERIQRVVNRLLYGERDEPYAVISRLGRRLEETLTPDAILPTIVETVAGALKLPYVAIVLNSSTEHTVAAIGTAPPDPVRLPLAYQGEPVGELLLAPRALGESFTPADRRLLADLARQAGVAARAVRLADEARQLATDLQTSRERLVTAREEERRRLRRDLHDGLGPALASQALTVDTAQLLLERDPQAASVLLKAVKEQSQAAVAEIRRVAYALRPPALDDLGLVGALRDAASKYAGTDLNVAVAAPAELPALPAAVEVAAFRIAQEAVANVARHAQARHCTVALVVGAALEMTIADDGVGIAAGRRAGVGLASMRERAEELGGTCMVEPNPGGGTRVTARLPLS